jgi:hypothetical protein
MLFYRISADPVNRGRQAQARCAREEIVHSAGLPREGGRQALRALEESLPDPNSDLAWGLLGSVDPQVGPSQGGGVSPHRESLLGICLISLV